MELEAKLKIEDLFGMPNVASMLDKADQLSLEYGVPAGNRQEIAIRAKMYKDQLTDWDVEVYSTFFQPDMRMSTNNRGY